MPVVVPPVDVFMRSLVGSNEVLSVVTVELVPGILQLPSSYLSVSIDLPLTSSAPYFPVLFELSKVAARRYPVPPSQGI